MASLIPFNAISSNYPVAMIGDKATGGFTFEAVRYFQQQDIRVTNLEQPIITVPTGAYTMTADNHVIMASTTAGSFSVLLPDPTALDGASFLFKNIGTANSLTLDAGTNLIDPGLTGGGSTIALTTRQAVLLMPYDGNWYIMAKYA